MTWNYRVFREENGEYVIREVFYREDGAISGCTENSVEPMGESLEELAADLAHFQRALTLPVLTIADMPTGELLPIDETTAISHEALLVELGLDPTTIAQTAIVR
jgi:hypothetical protein